MIDFSKKEHPITLNLLRSADTSSEETRTSVDVIINRGQEKGVRALPNFIDKTLFTESFVNSHQNCFGKCEIFNFAFNNYEGL